MTFDRLIESLRKEIINELPGTEAQYRLAPVGRPRLNNLKKPEGAREAGVCIVNYLVNGEPSFLLIKRTGGGGVHSSQIAFPGGKVEVGETPVEAALRECEEETGLNISPNNVIGPLTPLFIPVSNFFIHPVVTFWRDEPVFRRNEREVDEILPVPLHYLLEDKAIKSTEMLIRDTQLNNVPCFIFHGKVVWGATAMVLAEYRELLLKTL